MRSRHGDPGPLEVGEGIGHMCRWEYLCECARLALSESCACLQPGLQADLSSNDASDLTIPC